MGIRVLMISVILSSALLSAQTTKVRSQPKPQPTPQEDDLTSARAATDKFLNGVKLAELPEGRQLLSETQWITGEADHGKNFYFRPRFTEVTSLFEKLFDTDVPVVQGYERLLDMKAVSEAGTPLLTRYFMVAFKDRRTNKWKVLGTYENLDVDHEIAFAGQRLHETSLTSEQDNYLSYGKWLLLAGRTKEARDALTTALNANTSPSLYGLLTNERTTADASLRRGVEKDAALHRVQIQTLLGVIDAIVGN